MSRLVVVSNRVPVPKGTRPPEGGLATALLAALQSRGGLWFGWSGGTTTESMPPIECVRQGAVEFQTLPLTKRDYDEYYKGYSNRVLWPLLHLRLDRMEYRRHFEEGYRRVNRLLAQRLLPLLRPDDVIWIHDYHLISLGKELQRAGCPSTLGFFLHVPFPPYDVLRALPRFRGLLLDLLAYDLIGFHTQLDLGGFQNSVLLGLPGSTISGNEIAFESHRTETGVFPIGIDVDEVQKEALRAKTSSAGRRLSASLGGRRLIMGVDRLDYTKGLLERLRAFERLLERSAELRGRIVLLQIAQPSRGDVPEYESMRRVLESATGEINGRFAEYDWAPIRYLHKGLPRATVLGFLSIAEVGLVTPLRDGMNLVAKEFVAAQDPEDPGVLVLSDLTGAARELDAAVIVNPYDTDDVADGLAQALSMTLDERRERFHSMLDAVRRNDIHRWRQRFLEALDRARSRAAASTVILSESMESR